MFWMALVLGCTGDDSSECASTDLVLADEHNYSYSGTLDFPTYTTAENVPLVVDYSQLTKDMLCHDLDPAVDVVHAGLSLFQNLPCPDLLEGFTKNTVLQSDLFGYVDIATLGATSIQLTEMTYAGNQVDVQSLYSHQDDGCWIFNLSAGDSFDDEILYAAILDPLPESDVETAYLEDDCEVADFDFNLSELTSLPVEADACSVNVDWSGIVYTAQGDFFKPSEIDTVMLARYSDKGAADLEAQFLDLELIADDLWIQSVSGDDASLEGLVTADGKAFEGFDTESTWVLALLCSSCRNPAPLFLTLLDPS